MTFDALPEATTEDGRPRAVGIELEFGGLPPRAAADSLVAAVGGTVVADGPHSFRICRTSIGDVTIELDARHAHPAKYGHELSLKLSPLAADLFGRYAGWAVPTELITQPLTLDRFGEVERIIAELRSMGARGVSDIAWRQFGFHLNPEVAKVEVDTISGVLRAYILLEEALRAAAMEGLPRYRQGLLPPIFPLSYARKILSPDYRPSMSEFLQDYLAENPTRHRGLDLLPLLAFVDLPTVRRVLPAEKIRPRPVFHYRLPLSRIDRAGWSIAADWNLWVSIERLAADKGRLASLSEAFLASGGVRPDWGSGRRSR